MQSESISKVNHKHTSTDGLKWVSEGSSSSPRKKQNKGKYIQEL